MPLVSDLETLVTLALSGTGAETPSPLRYGFGRDGLTQGGLAFEVRPLGAEITAWERPSGAAKAHLAHRFTVELREALTGDAAGTRERMISRMAVLASKLAAIDLIPPESVISQTIPGAPVIRTKTGGAGLSVIAAELPVTVLEK